MQAKIEAAEHDAAHNCHWAHCLWQAQLKLRAQLLVAPLLAHAAGGFANPFVL